MQDDIEEMANDEKSINSNVHSKKHKHQHEEVSEFKEVKPDPLNEIVSEMLKEDMDNFQNQ